MDLDILDRLDEEPEANQRTRGGYADRMWEMKAALQRVEGEAHRKCPGGVMLMLIVMVVLFYHSSSVLTSFHPGLHKHIAVTLLDGSGQDYPCDDSDGPDKTTACQIHCVSNPCMEPYRLCIAHPECTAIAVNKDLSFATLKSSLFAHASASATPVNKHADWQGWWDKYGESRLPNGTYASSCGGCSLAAGFLTCNRCLNNMAVNVQATVTVDHCATFTFENKDGTLQCIGWRSGEGQDTGGVSQTAAGESGKGVVATYHPSGRHKRIDVTMQNGAGKDCAMSRIRTHGSRSHSALIPSLNGSECPCDRPLRRV